MLGVALNRLVLFFFFSEVNYVLNLVLCHRQ